MRLRVLALALIFICSTSAATERWQTLPPTPSLPADTRGQHAMINGARLWYAVWGTPGTAAPVLLLHGGLGNSSYFGHLIPALRHHGYRVIAIDSRGHGRSTRSQQHTTYHLMAEDVIALLDRLKVPKVRLVGWSDGGVIGLDIAIHHPERLQSLFSFGADADTSGLVEGFENGLFGEYMKRTEAEYAALAPHPQDWRAFTADLDNMWQELPQYSASELHSIRVPTTIADAQYDEAIKADHYRYIAASIPHARLVVLPNLSHFALLQDPDNFDAAVLASFDAR